MIICLGTTPTVQRTMAFDRLAIDAVNRAKSVCEYSAGKAVNAARVIHTLNHHVLLTGFVGGDTGRFIRADLDREKIPHEFVTVDPPTRLCVTLIDQSAGTATELVEESRRLRAENYDALLQTLAQVVPRATALVLAGHLPPDAPEDFYANCVKLAEPKVPVILDAVGGPLLAALAHRPRVVKINHAELLRTLGNDDAQPLFTGGAQWLVVTRGANPTRVTNGCACWQITTPPVKVVSAIGSGDSFAGGLAVALSRGEEMPQACRLAAACAAANAMTANAGEIVPQHVQQLTKQISVDPA